MNLRLVIRLPEPTLIADTEAARNCFVVLITKETNVASCLAARLDDVNRVFDVKASELDSLLTDALIPLRY